MIKRVLGLCEDKGCYRKTTKNVMYLKKDDSDSRNIRVCEKCFRKYAKR